MFGEVGYGHVAVVLAADGRPEEELLTAISSFGDFGLLNARSPSHCQCYSRFRTLESSQLTHLCHPFKHKAFLRESIHPRHIDGHHLVFENVYRYDYSCASTSGLTLRVPTRYRPILEMVYNPITDLRDTPLEAWKTAVLDNQ